MLAYWSMYLLPAGMTMLLHGGRNQHKWVPWILIGLLFIFLVGFRHEVGGDWFNYLYHYQGIARSSLARALLTGDPGYVFLNWLMASWGWGIYGVNLIAATIFVIGLFIFCRQQAKPWLAFTVSVPYLVTVVSMGYTRQAMAIGLFLWALAHIERGSFKHFIVLLAIAALFHKTAVLMIPLGIFLYGKGWFFRVIAVVLTVYGLWDLLLAQYQEALWKNYVEAQMISEGARIRVAMNFIPSVILLLTWRRWQKAIPNFWFWFWIAIGSVVSIAFVDDASTAVDRMALYFIPIQMAVFSRLPDLLSKHISPNTTTVGVILGYALVLFVWLNYASHAKYWLPYENVLFL